jgi:hypothetical protein
MEQENLYVMWADECLYGHLLPILEPWLSQAGAQYETWPVVTACLLQIAENFAAPPEQTWPPAAYSLLLKLNHTYTKLLISAMENHCYQDYSAFIALAEGVFPQYEMLLEVNSRRGKDVRSFELQNQLAVDLFSLLSAYYKDASLTNEHRERRLALMTRYWNSPHYQQACTEAARRGVLRNEWLVGPLIEQEWRVDA